MQSANRTFRIFVSSTFSDMRVERGILQAEVFPKLKKFCEEQGASFQAIDLRWGVNEESQREQKTMEICLNEIARCQRLSPRPNFIILLGDRYGWQPIPDKIPSTEIDKIHAHLTDSEAKLIDNWYKEDTNAVPSEYVLQPRGEEYRNYSMWQAVEDNLREILRKAVDKTTFSVEQRIKYFASATHQEIINGALIPSATGIDPGDHVFAYLRTIDKLPQDKTAGDFIDLTPDGILAPYAKGQMARLKEELQGKLPKKHIYEYPSQWNGGVQFDEKAFADRVYDNLKSVIEKELRETASTDELTREKKIHADFRDRLTEFFTGQEDALKQISSYIEKAGNKPLALIGPSGSGKSSIMAQAIHSAIQSLTKGGEGGFSVFRFIGVTSASSNLNSLLGQVCEEIANAYNVELKSLLKEGENEEKLSTYEGLKEIFRRCLSLASEEKPLLIFLDALDQLQTPKCDFLNLKLPDHARIIVSALPELKDKLAFADIFMLPLMKEDTGKKLLDKWLLSEKRSLTKAQREELIGKFSKNGLPIYLKLAFEQARKWHSYDKSKALPKDVEGILAGFFDLLEKAHTEELVSRAIGYLLSGKYGGLTEPEVLDLLAFDNEYWQGFLERCHPAHRAEVEKAGKLPMVVWSRLYLDLEPYLAERDADGIKIMAFYHRSFSEYARKRYPLHYATLADYFEKEQPLYVNEKEKIPNIRKVAEQPYQQTHGEQWDALEKTLTDLEFVEAKCRAGMVYELVADYDRIEAGRARLGSLIITARLHKDKYGIFCPFCLTWKEIKKEQLCSMINCPSCGSGLMVNTFVIEAGWEATDQQRKAETRKETIIDIPKSVSEFADFVRGQSHILKERPELTFQQAINQPYVLDPYKKAAILLESGGITRPWIKWKNKPQDISPCIMTLEGHTSSANSCAYSPDGKRIVSGSDDKTVKIWDAETGNLLHTFEGHTDQVSSCAYSPDGRRIVSVSEDKTVKIWDAETGTLLQTLEGHSSPVRSCAYSPDGKRIVSGASDRTVKIWDAETGNLLHTLEALKNFGTWTVSTCSYSPDGRRIVSGFSDETVKVWDAETGNLLQTLEGHTCDVRSCAYSPDGRKIVSGHDDNTVRIWNADTGALIQTLGGHTSYSYVYCAYSPDGKRIVSGSSDKTVKVWDAEAGTLLHTLEGHTSAINSCAYSPDGRRIVSGSSDETVKVWDAETGILLHTLEDHTLGVRSCTYSPDGRRIVSGSKDYAVKIWDTETGKLLKTLDGHNAMVNALAYSPDGRRIVSGVGGLLSGPDKTMKIWDAETGKLLRTLEGHNAGIKSLAYSPDGRRIISGAEDKTIKIWDAETGKRLRTLEGHTSFISSCTYSPDGRRIISGSADRTVKIWNAEKGNVLHTLEGHSGSVSSCAYSPDGRRIISGSFDETVNIWDSDIGSLLHTFICHTGRIGSCEYLRDGRRIVSGSSDCTVKICDAETGRQMGVFLTLSDCTSVFISIGNKIAACDEFAKIYLLELVDIQDERPFVTPIRLYLFDKKEWDDQISAKCEWCGKRFVPDESILATIRTINAHLSSYQEPCLHLPPEVWNDPRLFSECPHCHKPLRFNPFIVDNRDKDGSSFRNEISLNNWADIPPFPDENADITPATISMPAISTSFFAWAIKLLPNPTDYEAKAFYEKAMDMEGGLASYILWRIFKGILPMRRYQKAITLYDHALEKEPNCAKIHTAKGIVLARIGRKQEALKHFLEANRYAPNNAWVQANLARCYSEMGDEKNAIYWHRLAKSNQPG